jgi:hypothetical protein
MTELAHAPANDYGEQLLLEFDDGDMTGTTDMVVPADVSEEIVHSPVYRHLVELRDAAYDRRRSGARAIAREALVALWSGELGQNEFNSLFEDCTPEPREPQFEELSTEHPPHEPDWAERAAGETVRHPWAEDD